MIKFIGEKPQHSSHNEMKVGIYFYFFFAQYLKTMETNKDETYPHLGHFET
jgi:hypothetical protein